MIQQQVSGRAKEPTLSESFTSQKQPGNQSLSWLEARSLRSSQFSKSGKSEMWRGPCESDLLVVDLPLIATCPV